MYIPQRGRDPRDEKSNQYQQQPVNFHDNRSEQIVIDVSWWTYYYMFRTTQEDDIRGGHAHIWMMTGRDTWADEDEEGSDYKEFVTYKEVVYYYSQEVEEW